MAQKGVCIKNVPFSQRPIPRNTCDVQRHHNRDDSRKAYPKYFQRHPTRCTDRSNQRKEAKADHPQRFYAANCNPPTNNLERPDSRARRMTLPVPQILQDIPHGYSSVQCSSDKARIKMGPNSIQQMPNHSLASIAPSSVADRCKCRQAYVREITHAPALQPRPASRTAQRSVTRRKKIKGTA